MAEPIGDNPRKTTSPLQRYYELCQEILGSFPTAALAAESGDPANKIGLLEGEQASLLAATSGLPGITLYEGSGKTFSLTGINFFNGTSALEVSGSTGNRFFCQIQEPNWYKGRSKDPSYTVGWQRDKVFLSAGCSEQDGRRFLQASSSAGPLYLSYSQGPDNSRDVSVGLTASRSRKLGNWDVRFTGGLSRDFNLGSHHSGQDGPSEPQGFFNVIFTRSRQHR